MNEYIYFLGVYRWPLCQNKQHMEMERITYVIIYIYYCIINKCSSAHMVVCGPHSPSITAHGLSMSFCLLLFVGAKEDNAHCSNYHTSSSSSTLFRLCHLRDDMVRLPALFAHVCRTQNATFLLPITVAYRLLHWLHSTSTCCK